MSLKIAWGITGAGDIISNNISFMKDLMKRYDLDIHVFLSREGEVVLKFYKLLDEVKNSFAKVSVEKGPNYPFLAGRLQTGVYDLFIISPATANTVAKIACCIADSLITNAAAQAMKVNLPVYILPVDQKEGSLVTKLPNGKDLVVRVRKEDVEMVDRLRNMEGITVLSNLSEIEDVIKTRIPKPPI